MAIKWTVGTKIATGFAVAVVVFLAVGFVSYRSTAQLIETAQLRRHTDESLDAISDVRLGIRGTGIALRTYIISGEDAHYDAFKTSQGNIADPIPKLRETVSDSPSQAQRADKIAAMLAQYLAAVNGVADVRRAKGFQAGAQALLADDTRAFLSEFGNLLTAYEKEQNEVLARRTELSDRETRIAQLSIIVGNVVALVLALIAGYWLTRNISAPLRELTKATEKVTEGDLSGYVVIDSRQDEIGVLSRALERMTEALRSMARNAESIAIGDLRAEVIPQSDRDVLGNAFARMSKDLRKQIGELIDGASALSAAAGEIVASSSQLAASATQSAAAVSETTTTVEEVRQTAQLASQKARLVSESAQNAVAVSETGRKSTRDAEAGMARIRQQMEAIASSMGQLSEQSQAVGQIIATVEDIATQSNLLAVNAAIEAAKAGEHGKGFGVVAQEVKSLAEQSRQATTQVRNILRDIQRATGIAVMATEEGGKVVDAGTRQTEAAGGAIAALGGSVNEAAQAALQIAASSQQQLVGVDQVAGAMVSINEASVQNVASANQLEVTARGINEIGHRLKSMVERYKV